MKVSAFASLVDLGELDFRTTTLNNGTELHSHMQLEVRGELRSYLSTPYDSWERGTNENANGPIRQYLPKGKCFSVTITLSGEQVPATFGLLAHFAESDLLRG